MTTPHSTFITRHPLRAFYTLVLPFSWIVLGTLLAYGQDLSAGLLLVVFVGLLGTSVFITHRLSGRKGVKQLFKGVTRWKIHFGWYLLVLGALPLLTLGIAGLTGYLQTPDKGWVSELITYLLSTVLVGAIIFNVWEETAWAGFVQTRLMNKHGLLKGSVLTAYGFIAIHLPIVFQENGLKNTSLREALISLAVLVVLAFFIRYLIGSVLIDTGGSLLAVGLLHASFNSSGSLTAIENQYPSIIALVLLTVLFAVYRRSQDKSLVNVKAAS